MILSRCKGFQEIFPYENSVFFLEVLKSRNLSVLKSLFRSLAMKYDIPDDAPEVAPVGGEGVLQVGFQVAAFAFLNLLDGLGSLVLVVERRQHAGFGAGAPASQECRG